MLEVLDRPGQTAAAGFETLACPAPESGVTARHIVRAYAAAILAAGLARTEEAAGAPIAFLAEHADTVVEDAIGWDRGFGAVHDALAGVGALRMALTEVALRLSACGVPGRWDVRLDRPVRWRFANLLLPAATALRVEGDGDGVLIMLDGGRPLRLRGLGMAWRPADATAQPAVTVLPTVAIEGGAARTALCPGVGLFPFGERLQNRLLALPFSDRWIDAVETALAQLRAAAPAYATWVGDVVRYIVPCSAPAETLSSGSSSRMLGVVRITADMRPEAIVEMLVHEASHQYYYVAGMTGDVADPADQRLFFSPAKQTGRQIDKILLAYHAFANVEAAFAGCLAARVGNSAYYGPQFERLVGELDLMENHLRTAGSLTPLGEALCDRLIRRRDRH